ncbi:MAG: HD domain-containing phosphohydrolase [Betaproteobacteria bacterium]
MQTVAAQKSETITDQENFALGASYQQLFRVIDDLKTVVHQRNEAQNEVAEGYFETMYLLALAADYRTGRNESRLLRIGSTAGILARASGQSTDYCLQIRRAAPLHDIGMVAIPDVVLRKKSDLTADEWGMLKTHTDIGARMLGAVSTPVLQMAAEIALMHHENFQGKGYPAGRVAGDIPLSARIVALAEYFESCSDEFTQQRGILPPGVVLASIRERSGTRFDPDLVDLFFVHLQSICDARKEIEFNADSLQALVSTIRPLMTN